MLVVLGAESLQGAQTLYLEQERPCLTARYRLRRGPPFGNLLGAFASDILGVPDTPAGPPLGDLLPAPGPSTSWEAFAGDAGWDQLTELAYMPRLDRATLGQAWLRAFRRGLRSLPRGHRLVLLGEVAEDPGPPEAWSAALSQLDILPPGVALVVSGPPPGWGDGLPGVRTFAAAAAGSAESNPIAVPRFVEAALSGDQPAELDRLGTAPLADAVARLVLLRDTLPLVIAVHAPWGRGKSSFMRFMHDALILRADDGTGRSGLQQAESDIAVAERESRPLDDLVRQRRALLDQARHAVRRTVVATEFNVWRYEGARQIWAGLAMAISEQLEGALSRPRRLRSRVAYALRRRRLQFWLGFVVPAVLALLLAVILLVTGATRVGGSLPDWLDWLTGVVPTTVIAAAIVAWRFARVVQPVGGQVARYLGGPDYRAELGYQQQVIEDLRFLRARVPGRPRVVVFIDDLDRCSDESIIDTLQAVHLVLGASDFFVVLGIDTDMIYRAIIRRYDLAAAGDAADAFAENYLRKIVQLSVHLPRAAPDQRFAFIERLFSPAARAEYAQTAGPPRPPPPPPPPPRVDGSSSGLAWERDQVVVPRIEVARDVQDTVDELAAFADYRQFIDDNPRELKRLVNVHRLVKIMLLRRDAPPTAAAQRKLVAWLLFCARWPALVDDVLSTAGAGDMVWQAEPHGVDRDLDAFLAQLRDTDPLTAEDLTDDSTLARAARISQLVRDRPAPGRGARV